MVYHPTKILDDRQSRETAVLDPIDRESLTLMKHYYLAIEAIRGTTAALSNFPCSHFLSSQKGFDFGVRHKNVYEYSLWESVGTSMTLSRSRVDRPNKLVAHRNEIIIHCRKQPKGSTCLYSTHPNARSLRQIRGNVPSRTPRHMSGLK